MNHSAKKTSFQKHPKKTIILFLLLIFVMLDVSLGLIFIPKKQNHFRIFHPYYHHGLKKNINTITTWDNINQYKFCTNSLGFRDDKVKNVELDTKRTRILLIGDSHTEGVGLPFEKTFSGIIVRKTNNHKYEFLNAGVVSYSPKLYFLRTKYLVEKLKLKIDHLLVFIDISDIQNELAYMDFVPADNTIYKMRMYRLKRFVVNNSFLLSSINTIRENRQRNKFYKSVNKEEKNPKTDIYSTFFTDFANTEFLRDKAFHNIGLWYLDKSMFEKWGRKGLCFSSDYMQMLVALCHERNIKLSISVHPWPIQIKYGDENSIQVQFWTRFAEHHKIGLINLFPEFFRRNRTINVIKEYYQHGDVHWNEKGHEIAAEAILQYLKKSYPDIDSIL